MLLTKTDQINIDIASIHPHTCITRGLVLMSGSANRITMYTIING